MMRESLYITKHCLLSNIFKMISFSCLCLILQRPCYKLFKSLNFQLLEVLSKLQGMMQPLPSNSHMVVRLYMKRYLTIYLNSRTKRKTINKNRRLNLKSEIESLKRLLIKINSRQIVWISRRVVPLLSYLETISRNMRSRITKNILRLCSN